MSKKAPKERKPRPSAPVVVVHSVKPVSSMMRYGYLREVGVKVNGSDAILRGDELDRYIDTQIFRLKHPDKPESREVP